MPRLPKVKDQLHRKRGEGSCYQTTRRWKLADGTKASKTEWVAAVSEGFVKGRRKRKFFRGDSLAEVLAARNRYLVKKGESPPAGSPSEKEAATVNLLTVGDAAKAFLKDRMENKRRATYDSYEKTWRLHIKPSLGDLPLATLAAEDVTAAYDQIASPSMRKRAHVTLRQF